MGAGGAAEGAADDVLLPLLPPPALPQPLLALGGGRRCCRLPIPRRVPRGLHHAASRPLALALSSQPPLRGGVAVADAVPLAHPPHPAVAGTTLPAPLSAIEWGVQLTAIHLLSYMYRGTTVDQFWLNVSEHSLPSVL